MKKLKYLIPIILSLAVLVTIFVISQIPAKAAVVSGTFGASGDNLTWELDNETYTLTISGSGPMYYYGYDDDQPWYEYRSVIKSVRITDGVTSIGGYAFSWCSNLTSITIPDSVTSIGEGAFEGCSGLTSITVESGNTKYHSSGNCLIATFSKTLILGCNNSIIPADGSVASIVERAFDVCSGLTSITIPSSVMSIGESAFVGCSNLTKVYISSPSIVAELTSSNECGELIYRATAILIDSAITSVPNYITTNYPYTSNITEDGVTYTAYTESKCTFGHDYGEEWTSNYSQHYHKCKNCNSTIDRAAHSYDNSCDTSCNICGYTRTITHNYYDNWLKGQTLHWYECSICGFRKDESTHDYNNNCDTTCNTCGYTRTITHSYSTEWSSDVNNHWKECSCGDKKDIGDHIYDNTCDTECNTCGYIRTITHNYKTTWSSDTNTHWHECSVCHVKKDEATHTFDTSCDTECNVCGYTRTVTHNYRPSWSNDENTHWHECSICGDKKDEANHAPGAPATEYAAQLCTVCQYVIESALGHTHKYSDEWTFNRDAHWYACSGCSDKKDVGDHIYDNTCDTTCNTCGYIRTITHTYNTVWSKNDTHHWYECSVCHVKKDETTHVYDNACDTVCNTCGHNRVTTHRYDNACDVSCNICGDIRTITHSYKSSWSKDKNTHRHECSVCHVKKDEASHTHGAPATETEDQVCTVCSYVIATALGHTHTYNGEWEKDGNNHWKECNCGEKSSVSAHTWDSGVVTHEPSVELEGEKTFTCTVCFATKTEAIDKLDPPADEPNDPETPEEPDNSETPSDDKQESGSKDESSTPSDTTNTPTAPEESKDSNTVIIIIAAVAVIACGGMAVAMVVILKKKK